MIARTALVVGVAGASVGCSRFVWHEDPFTPDQAPVTETIATTRDTTYVLRGSSYYLLARQRAALWNRDIMDDVASRYRSLFGETPPVVAVRIDSAVTSSDSSTWRGVPLASVSLVPRRDSARDGRGPRGGRLQSQRVVYDAVRGAVARSA